MAKLVMYQDKNFGGPSREITDNISNLGSIGFNDRANSIKVMGSVWVGYEHTSYKGQQWILEEGEYKHVSNQLSSFKKLDVDVGETPQITLYEHTSYKGNAVTFTYGINNLNNYKFNDQASSIRVKSGNWILFQDYDFTGWQNVIGEGSYYAPSLWGGSNDRISSLRPVTEPSYPTEVLSMEFDIAAGLLNSNPEALVNMSQRNDTSIDQKATWSTSRTVTTTKTYEWHWENSTAIRADYTFKVGVPIIAQGEIAIGFENNFSIGENRGQENTQSDEWTFSLPATVKAKTQLRVQAVIQQGKIDVPFKAILKKGNKRWEEKGTYKGTQSFNLQVDFKESPL